MPTGRSWGSCLILWCHFADEKTEAPCEGASRAEILFGARGCTAVPLCLLHSGARVSAGRAGSDCGDEGRFAGQRAGFSSGWSFLIPARLQLGLGAAEPGLEVAVLGRTPRVKGQLPSSQEASWKAPRGWGQN